MKKAQFLSSKPRSTSENSRVQVPSEEQEERCQPGRKRRSVHLFVHSLLPSFFKSHCAPTTEHLFACQALKLLWEPPQSGISPQRSPLSAAESSGRKVHSFHFHIPSFEATSHHLTSRSAFSIQNTLYLQRPNWLAGAHTPQHQAGLCLWFGCFLLRCN